MKKICKVILAAAAVVALAVPALMAGSAFAADKLKVQDSTGNNTIFTVTDDGRMGLGAAPANIFDIQKVWATPSSTNLVTAISVYADQARYTFRRANGNTVTPAALNNGDSIGNLNFRGHDGTNWNTAAVAAISINAEEGFGPTNAGARMSFFTQSKGVAAGSGGTERFRISANGNVIAANNGGLNANVPVAVTAVDGHFYIPTVNGAVTSCSTMTVYNGHAPIWFDATNFKVCSCIGGALKCTAAMN